MLPTHRPPPAIEHLSKASNRPVCGLNRLALRWITLTATVFASLWFFLPSIRGYIWEPADFGLDYSIPRPLPPQLRPETLVTTENQFFWDARKNEVKEGFEHAYGGYKRLAFPSDEVLPLSGGKTNK